MKSLTVRLDARQARALAEASRETGRPVSDIVREALEVALSPDTIGVRAGHVRGRLRLLTRRAGWQASLRARNVRT